MNKLKKILRFIIDVLKEKEDLIEHHTSNEDINNKNILIKTLYFEAGSTQEIFDVLMVGWVIRNRVRGPGHFGKTYKDVCLKKWQFSCWNGKTIQQISRIIINGKSFRWTVCSMVASYIMTAPESHNPLPGVCFYFNPDLCRPSWAEAFKRFHPLYKLNHVFYKGGK